MRRIFKSKFRLPSLTAAFVLMLGLGYLAGSVNGSNAALAQANTPAPVTTPGQAGAGNSQPVEDNETADGPQGAEPASGTAPEEDNQAALQAQAKITPDQAKQAALAKVPGTVVSANLEDENGKAVYTVIVTPSSGGSNQDVKVDAVTGNVVKVEAGDQEEGSNSEN